MTTMQAIDASLQANFLGEMMQPGDAPYDEARKIWNGDIDRKPALIARCRGVADVIAAVRFARDKESASRSAAEGMPSRVTRSSTTAW